MSERIPNFDEMGGRKAWAWAGWRMFKDNCRRRHNPNYSFDKLPIEEQLADYKKFEKVYEEEKGLPVARRVH